MSNLKFFLIALAITLLSTGCAKSPTKITQAVDARPVVSFVSSQETSNMSLHVNGVSLGNIDSYQYPKNSIRLIAGMNKIEVRYRGEIIYQKDHFLADGSTYRIQLD